MTVLTSSGTKDNNNKKTKRAVLLFEVTIVVLIVSIASLFLFKGYNIFVRSMRKGLDYLALALLLEQKVWELQEKECHNEFTADMEHSGSFDDPAYEWLLDIEDTKEGALGRSMVKITHHGRHDVGFDVFLYFLPPEEEEKEK